MAKEAEMLWTKSSMKELDWLISSDMRTLLNPARGDLAADYQCQTGIVVSALTDTFDWHSKNFHILSTTRIWQTYSGPQENVKNLF